MQIYNKIDVGDTLTVTTVIDYLKRKFPKANAENILSIKSEYDEKRQVGKWSSLVFSLPFSFIKSQLKDEDHVFFVLQDGALFYKKSGLGALPLALFNGIPLNPDEMDPDELEAIILQRIMDTTTAFQRAVFMVDASALKKSFSFYLNYL